MLKNSGNWPLPQMAATRVLSAVAGTAVLREILGRMPQKEGKAVECPGNAKIHEVAGSSHDSATLRQWGPIFTCGVYV